MERVQEVQQKNNPGKLTSHIKHRDVHSLCVRSKGTEKKVFDPSERSSCPMEDLYKNIQLPFFPLSPLLAYIVQIVVPVD